LNTSARSYSELAVRSAPQSPGSLRPKARAFSWWAERSPGWRLFAEQINARGGAAQTALIDVLDDAAVNRYFDSIVKQTGKIDIVVDATGPLPKEYGNGKIAVELPDEEFMVPLATIVKARFITARAAARHMIAQKSGVIIFVTGSPARGHVPGATAIGAAFGAIETLTENLAFEISPFGVRVVCLRTLANIDSRSIQDTMDVLAGKFNITKDQAMAQIAMSNFLKVPTTVQDTANAAVLIASDRARMVTGTVVNAQREPLWTDPQRIFSLGSNS
jgi:3-oxoacyl-[acyl-carrier protein] reductase